MKHKNVHTADPQNCTEVLFQSAVAGDLAMVKNCIASMSCSVTDISVALLCASEKGNIECVEFLIPLADPTYNESQALRWAANNGHTEIVKLLLPVSDPKADDSEALSHAASHGHTEIVKLLLPLSDPKTYDSQALRWAARHGHTECVKLLIPVSDPKAYDSEALRLAAVNGHTECAELLVSVSNYDVVLKMLLDCNKNTDLLQQCIDKYESEKQKTHINKALTSIRNKTQKISVKRKM